MYIIFSIWHELSLLILNIVPVAKHLMAVTSFTKLLQESYFFLQLFYPCFVLSRRSFLMLYGSLLSNKSFRLFSLLLATRILFSGNNLFRILLFCIKWKVSLIILVTFGPLGLNFVGKITLLMLLLLLTIFFLASFWVILLIFFKSIMNCIWIMTSMSKIILIFYWFRWVFIICTANTS